MCTTKTKSVIRVMSERDPFLRDNLQKRKYQKNIHEAYLQLSQSISDLLRPPTPEKEEVPVPKRRMSKDQSGRRSKMRRRKSVANRGSAMSNYGTLEKYRLQPVPSILQIPGSRESSRENSNRSRRSSVQSRRPTSNRAESKKGSKRAADVLSPPVKPPTSVDPHWQRYSIRYSKVLDIFKRKLYRDLISSLGIDINHLDDPSTVEIDLAWCKVGSFILESRDNTFLSFAQFVEETASLLSERDLDERMSLYSGYSSFLPPVSRAPSIRSCKSPSGDPDGSTARSSRSPSDKNRFEKNRRDFLSVDENRQRKVPKLPAIGENF